MFDLVGIISDISQSLTKTPWIMDCNPATHMKYVISSRKTCKR